VPNASPRRVALLAPMPSELRPLVRRLELTRSALGDLPVHAGTVGEVEVVATRTGMGTASAAEVTRQVLDAATVDHLCIVGIAGGLRPDVEIGTVVVPDTVIDHATGAEYHPRPFGDALPEGTILTSNDLLDNDVLDGFRERGVVAVDMETAAVGAICEARGCSWSAVRSISDRTVDGTVSDEVFRLAKPDGSPNLGASLRYLLTRPWRIPALVRLARDATVAAGAAAAAAAHACHELA